jgi:hypothetical protein
MSYQRDVIHKTSPAGRDGVHMPEALLKNREEVRRIELLTSRCKASRIVRKERRDALHDLVARVDGAVRLREFGGEQRCRLAATPPQGN